MLTTTYQDRNAYITFAWCFQNSICEIEDCKLSWIYIKNTSPRLLPEDGWNRLLHPPCVHSYNGANLSFQHQKKTPPMHRDNCALHSICAGQKKKQRLKFSVYENVCCRHRLILKLKIWYSFHGWWSKTCTLGSPKAWNPLRCRRKHTKWLLKFTKKTYSGLHQRLRA